MSASETLLKEICSLRRQINQKEYSELELEALFMEIDDAIKQLTELRGKMFAELFSIKARDLRKTISGDHE